MATVIAQTLKDLGVQHVFGIVGIPVIEVAEALIAQGIRFVSFRNEQAATYAASVYGYLTGRPGVCLVVGGPGVIHALSGVENARANAFPLLLLAGSAESHQREKGAFQELNQVSAALPYTKMAAQPASVSSVPPLLEKAYRTAYFGRPGATYIDLPADIIQAKLPEGASIDSVTNPGAPPKSMADPSRVSQAAKLLASAKSPLLIVGKGVAYARAEDPVRKLFEATKIPFLPTPMGKGVLPDDHELNMSASRSAALKSADVVLLLGARLNWILHYGESPKFRPDVKFIQVDIAAEELGNNGGNADLGLVGDVGLVSQQLLQALGSYQSPPVPRAVADNRSKNVAKASKTESDTTPPLKYQAVYKAIRDTLSQVVPKTRNIVYVSEGANTMDVSRSSFPLNSPRNRLDAGTNATMGVGMGYAIAAKCAQPEDLVVAIEGDSAFGFSAMELETAVRSKLPMVIYVMNNSGIYHGVDPSAYSGSNPLPSTALQLNTKYHALAEALGAQGFEVSTVDQIKQATEKAVNSNKVTVINVIIDPGKDKKLEFGWMASTKPKI